MTAAEQFHLNWEKFDTNLKSSYAGLRETLDFSDVTLVCADGHQVEAHKVILATASPFFYNILQSNKHPHPLIYMKGLEWTDLNDIIDFIYHGEVSVAQNNLTEFLEISEELQIKGLSKGSYKENNENEQLEAEETYKENKVLLRNKEEIDIKKSKEYKTTVESVKSEPLVFSDNTEGQLIELPNSHTCIYCTNSYKLKDSLKTHIWRKHKQNKQIETEENVTESSNSSQSGDLIENNVETFASTDDMLVFTDGIWKCVVCNKQSHGKRKWDLIAHVETHMEGLSYKCKFCPTIAKSRGARNTHVYRKHGTKSV